MKHLLLFLLAISAFAQQGAQVNQSTGPEPVCFTSLFFYSGSDLAYSCKAECKQPPYAWTRQASTLTSIVVLTNTATATTSAAHGLAIGNLVTASGATVDSDLNGNYVILTVPSTTTFTFTTAAVANATYTEATLQISTTAPRTSAPVWEVKKFTTATSLVTAVQTSGGISTANQICNNRAVTTGTTKIPYQ